MDRKSDRLMLFGLILAVFASICLLIPFSDGKIEPDNEMYFVYLSLVILGFSAYFVQIAHKQYLTKEDYYLSIFLILAIVFTTIMSLLMGLTVQEWILLGLIFFVLLMLSLPVFRYYIKNKKRKRQN
ncbi:MAG: hypothetical protein JSV56_01990 [Methanomassiliicoccales archaeon]|nr:MAG: hypothetical protein JSV56_01990 [Methanomassiliicoccales archaeon]